MRDQVARTLVEERFLARVLFIFAFLATALCAAGVYGLVSYATEGSTNEFGIRIALGAQSSDVLGMVVRRGLLLTLVGLVIGFAAAVGLTRLVISVATKALSQRPVTPATLCHQDSGAISASISGRTLLSTTWR